VTAAFGLALVALVAAITAVDVDRRVIPDPLNVALAALGLAWQSLRHQAPPLQAALAAAAVFLFLWAIAAGFRRVRGVVGLGRGDVKMAAAARRASFTSTKKARTTTSGTATATARGSSTWSTASPSIRRTAMFGWETEKTTGLSSMTATASSNGRCR
jgi:hypothetical protein